MSDRDIHDDSDKTELPPRRLVLGESSRGCGPAVLREDRRRHRAAVS